jgi:hypothetical protein
MEQRSQLHHTIITECPEVSGCLLYTSSEESTTLEREIGSTGWGMHKLTYVQPSQYTSSQIQTLILASILILFFQVCPHEQSVPRALRRQLWSANSPESEQRA